MSRLDSSKKMIRKFAWIIGSVFVLLSGWMYFIRQIYFLPVLFCIIGGIVVFLSLVSPYKLKRVYKTWMGIAFVLGWFVSRMILMIVFFFLIIPIGSGMRLLNKPLLDLKLDKKKKTYWTKRTDKTIHYEKMF